MTESPVADASPLIILAQGGQLELLRVVGEHIVVPRPVAAEIRRVGLHDAAVEALQSVRWLEIVESEPAAEAVRRFSLDQGEEAVLTWALAHPGSVAIMDERRGRNAASSLGVPVLGTLGVILEARSQGAIALARPVVERLLYTTNWYVSRDLVNRALKLVGE